MPEDTHSHLSENHILANEAGGYMTEKETTKNKKEWN